MLLLRVFDHRGTSLVSRSLNRYMYSYICTRPLLFFFFHSQMLRAIYDMFHCSHSATNVIPSQVSNSCALWYPQMVQLLPITLAMKSWLILFTIKWSQICISCRDVARSTSWYLSPPLCLETLAKFWSWTSGINLISLWKWILRLEVKNFWRNLAKKSHTWI